ncbi:MAG: S53 family peptidase [Chloroflexota bacterium]
MRRGAAALGLLVALAACAHPVNRSHRAPAGGDAFPALIASSRDLGPVAPGRAVQLVLQLADPSERARADRLRAIYTPGNPDFGRPLTPAEYDRAFGPPAASVSPILRALAGAGLHAAWQPGNAYLTVDGPAAAVDAEFGTRTHDYQARSGRHFYASAGDPQVPEPLQPAVTAAAHLTDYAQARTHNVPPGGLKPSDLATAYDFKPLRDLGLDGTGETVVFMEVDGFDQADLDAYSAHFNLPELKAGPANLKSQGETIMDLEVVHAMVPQARLVLYNQQPTTNNGWLNRTSEMVNGSPGMVVSISLGGCEPADGKVLTAAEKAIYDKAVALGETVFVSTGDSGAYTCLTEDFGAVPSDEFVGASTPAIYPSVTAVGGTRLSPRADDSWLNEEVWEQPASTGGGGGNVSVFFPRPDWQVAPGTDNQYNPQKMRSIPDISADADTSTGVAILDTGSWSQGGGTSQSAPIWAGITVLVNQYLKKQQLKPVGFLNPALYALAAGKPPFPPFHDITIGTNLVYPPPPATTSPPASALPTCWNLARDLEAYQKNGGRI